LRLDVEGQISALVERMGVGNTLTGAVLLVDDEPHNVRVLRDLLEEQWTVHVAYSGEEALAVAARTPVDVVVADHRMPGMTGVDLLETLRQSQPDVAGIVLTGYADMAALESAINRARAFRFMRKPWESAEMIQAIEQASATVRQGRTIERLVALLASQSEELKASLEQLQAQQLAMLHLERLSTIGRLSSGVAHDLRNVVAGLRAAEWEMAEHALAPGLRQLLDLGLTHIDNLLRTLGMLREYSRSGNLEVSAAEVDAAALVTDAVALAQMDLTFRRRRVETELQPGLPHVRADRQKLLQVLVNLIRNGLEASPEGAPVRVVAAARGPDRIELAVEDRGPGVPAELKARLFQPFVSGKGELGLGMGLYMARLIVDAHGGAIEVGDRPGGGARFTVTLPSGSARAPGGATGGTG
jgi:signal transduction histidine kinase